MNPFTTENKSKILIVDDDPGTVRLLINILKDLGKTYFTTYGSEALSLALSIQPDIILLDVEMPDLDGLSLCKQIKNHADFADVPVLFVTGHTDVELEARALSAGAIDFIHKPPTPVLVNARVKNYLAFKQNVDRLKMLSMVDGLTGVRNRRAFDRALADEWSRAVRGSHSLSLLMIDVDDFKRFNDTYGHQAGDDCLNAVASSLDACAKRPGDMVARYGGEEFAILLPNCSLVQAMNLAEIIRDGVMALAIPHSASQAADVVTISVGVSHISHRNLDKPETMRSGESNLLNANAKLDSATLVKAADDALYAAKRKGRNQVESAPD